MTALLSGAPVAAALDEKTKAIAAMCKSVPKLAVIRVGESAGDLVYERSLVRRAERCGVSAKPYVFDADVSQSTLLAHMQGLAEDPAVHGMLLFQPLPEHLSDARLRAAIPPEKDVDGVTDASLSGVFTGFGGGFAPCTAEAVMELVGYYGIACAGREAVVIGRSLTVGKPLAMLLLAQNATVTICHSKTADLEKIARRADILVAAAGRAGLIGGACFTPGQTVIDVGMHVTESGLTGDAVFQEAEGIVSAITPVPGGVGAVTTGILMRHTALAALRAVSVGSE